MTESISELVEKAKNGEDDAKLKIIHKFDQLINKYCRLLGDNTLIIEFQLTILEVIEYIPIHNMKDEGCVINYFYKSIKSKYIKLSKLYNGIHKSETELNLDIISYDIETDIEEKIMIYDAMSVLSKKQKLL